ncbi:T9SS type A sorting domain-containing protein [Flavihumibacter fluvii]|uniref:T9SS type A sorting domain-containing protein n=1 Tax=Flavihumibacter fluvii TaxID=2838157 RepID=UPI001BDE7380|nr:T9SS type A sorting domain-containing protein [Flavihumibacter fluvii]ULQ50739.1 T9SS type A sorting domain-containing protein [Flavihumibacter fluvii]
MKSYLRQFSGIQQCIAFALLFSFFTLPLLAQVVEFPKDYQLYPRNTANNKATVRVSGSLPASTGYDAVILKVYRDGSLKSTLSTKNFRYDKGVGKYNFKTDIIAELANYTFSLYGSKSNVETLIVSADNVVAGDAYIIQGQSNAVANQRGGGGNVNDPLNSPNRSFVRVYGSGSATGAYTKAWFIGDGNIWFDVDGNIGQWGLRMASNIAGEKKIPVAVFNGASPGSPISYFSRNDANAADPATNYGRLLNRIREAGLQKNIRGVIWHQGESDVLGVLGNTQLSTDEYKTAFRQLVKDWKDDYKGIEKYYIFQIRYGCGMSTADNCLKIQEAQRQLGLESRDIVTISTGNTNQLFDGGPINYCHYDFDDGYKNMGDWVSNLMLRDLYRNSNLPATIESPEPESALFSVVGTDGIASQVRLALKDQSGSFAMTGDLSSLFRLDGGDYTISSVSLSGNNVLVNFSRAAGTTTNPVSISFRGHDMIAAPVITNSSGLALLNFENFPIQKISQPVSCAYAFEPNNSLLVARSILTDQTINAAIGSQLDADWYKFKTTARLPYIKVSLWNLADDYDIFLYNGKGILVAVASLSGTSPETLVYNLGTDNLSNNKNDDDHENDHDDENKGKDEINYWLKVVGKNGAYNSAACYSLRVQAAGAEWPADAAPYVPNALNSKLVIPMEEVTRISPQAPVGVSTYPNPVQQTLMINYPAESAGSVELRIVDLTGRNRMIKTVQANSGQNQFRMNVGNLTPGMYILQIRKGSNIVTTKFMAGYK